MAKLKETIEEIKSIMEDIKIITKDETIIKKIEDDKINLEEITKSLIANNSILNGVKDGKTVKYGVDQYEFDSSDPDINNIIKNDIIEKLEYSRDSKIKNIMNIYYEYLAEYRNQMKEYLKRNEK